MTELINMANWSGAQWVLLCLMFIGGLMKAHDDEFWTSVKGLAIVMGLLTWGGFWA